MTNKSEYTLEEICKENNIDVNKIYDDISKGINPMYAIHSKLYLAEGYTPEMLNKFFLNLNK